MTLRKAHPQEAEILWEYSQSGDSRHGYQNQVTTRTSLRWTPTDDMPEHYRQMVVGHRFLRGGR